MSGNTAKFVTMITVVATLGGLLFGYDTGVINGAIGYLAEDFGIDGSAKGWAAGSALFGCIIGAFAAGVLSLKLGRKKSLIISAIMFAISALGSAIPELLESVFSWTEAPLLNAFVAFRIIGGIGVGIASMLSPMYIAEIAPADIRGRLVSYNQIAIVAGFFVVYWANYIIILMGQDAAGECAWCVGEGWRWMFASELIPALSFLFLLFLVPESPRWLIQVGRIDDARAVLTKTVGADRVEQLVSEIKTNLDANEDGSRKQIKITAGIIAVVVLGSVLSIFQQITGINAILYYSNDIYKGIGLGTNGANIGTIVGGAVNFIATFIAIKTVDKYGRKPLMLIGTIGMAIGMLAFSYFTYTGLLAAGGMGSVLGLIFMYVYVASFALSLGPVTWVLLSEMFPNKIRSIGLSIAVAAQWIANLAVSWTFPIMTNKSAEPEKWTQLDIDYNGAFPFWVYGGFAVLYIFIIWKWVPETKGKTLEELEALWEPKEA